MYLETVASLVVALLLLVSGACLPFGGGLQVVSSLAQQGRPHNSSAGSIYGLLAWRHVLIMACILSGLTVSVHWHAVVLSIVSTIAASLCANFGLGSRLSCHAAGFGLMVSLVVLVIISAVMFLGYWCRYVATCAPAQSIGEMRVGKSRT